MDLRFVGQYTKFTEPDSGNFNDISGSGDAFGDPFAAGVITRPSKMNTTDFDTPAGGGSDDIPF